MTTIELRYDGTDILSHVILNETAFSTQVNGVAGTCQIAIRDDDNDLSFVIGKRLLLTLDGESVWTGYVANVRRRFFFDAEEAPAVRGFLIDGWDINILFRKRIVSNIATPTFDGPTYPDNTEDTTVLADLFDEWLDLSSDSIDTTTLVENVGTVNTTETAAPIHASETWGETVRRIDALTNAIFYIDPDQHFVHTDVDTPSAGTDLSDQPAGGAVGYRDMEITFDGTNLINDALVIGTEAGQGQVVAAREEDATSISAHGRWQYGEMNASYYKQASVDRRAASLVDGSPQSKRGAKNDRVSVACTVFTDGFRAAQKVDFTSNVFGFHDVIPIRRIDFSFVNSTQLRYRLYLSHEIDLPWSFFDTILYHYRYPGIPELPPIVDLPPSVIPEPRDPECDDCGITDSWERFVDETTNTGTTISGAYAGAADAGPTWSVSLGRGTACSVDSDLGLRSYRASPSTGFGSVSLSLPWPTTANDGTVTYTTRFTPQGLTSSIDGGDYDAVDLHFGASALVAFGPDTTIRINPSGAVLIGSEIAVNGAVSATSIPDNWWTNLTDYFVTITYSPTGTVASVTDGVTTYQSSSSTTLDFVNNPYLTMIRIINLSTGNHNDLYFLFGDLDITGVDRCAALQFDDFERTTTIFTEWANSTPSGYPWHGSGPGGYTRKIVENGLGKIEQGTGFVGGQTGMTMFGTDVPAGLFHRNTNFSMLVKFEAVAATSGHSALVGFFYDQTSAPFGRTAFGVTKNVGGGSGSELFLGRSDDSGSNTLTTSVTMDLNTFYYARYERTGTSHRVKYWEASSAEPSSWTLEDTGGITWGIADDFQVFQARDSSSSLDWKVWYDFIEFDYDGRPCYIDCTTSGTTHVIDDFTRSVSGSWGTATSGGTWSKTATTGTTTEDVDGDYGLIHYASTTPGASTRWTLSLPSWFSTATEVQWRTLMKTAVKSPLLGLYTSAETVGIEMQVTTAGATKIVTYGTYQSSTHSTNTSSFNWVDNAPFWLALKLDTFGNVYFKGWLASNPEPSSWEGPKTGASLTPDSIAKFLTSIGQVSAVSGDYGISYSEISIPYCTPVEQTVFPLTPVSGSFCEVIVPSGANLVCATAFKPGSSQVTVNGLHLRRGIDYTENPVEGLIVLDEVPTTGAHCRVCYYAVST